MQYRARGPRPQYFADEQLDRFHVVLVTLLQEVAVLRDRLDTVERMLDAHGTVTRAEIEAYRPTPAAAAERAAERTALIERVLRVVIEESAQIKTGGTGFATVADVVAAVSTPAGLGAA